MKKPLIAINDLQRHNSFLMKELEKAICKVLSSGRYVLGTEVEAFEAEFAAFCGSDYCVGVGNGTDALELSLRALGVGVNARVATVANAGMYSTTAIMAVGGVPIYIDVRPETLTMNPEALADAIKEDLSAIIVTHLYGQMADMPSLIRIAEGAGVPVIEDCAQAHGASLMGRVAGSWSRIGCFSFYPTKNLGALGDGGALVTSDENLSIRLKQLRQYGWTGKYRSDVSGGRNSRLDELQAAVLRIKLPYVKQWNERRRAIAQKYSKRFHDLKLMTPSNIDEGYIAHLYVMRTEDRERIKWQLMEKGVASDVHYPIPDYRQKSLQKILSRKYHLTVTEQACEEVLTLPCFPEMTEDEIDQVADAISTIYLR